jgi:hypothetical protein
MRGRGIGSYRLGDKYVSPDRKLSELLMQESARKGPAYHWSDTLGRIAQGLTGGYLAGRDRNNQNAANEAFTKVEADSFRQPTEKEAYAASPELQSLHFGYNTQTNSPLAEMIPEGLGHLRDQTNLDEPSVRQPTSMAQPQKEDSFASEEARLIEMMSRPESPFYTGDEPRPTPTTGGSRDYAQELARGLEAYQNKNQVLNEKMPQLDYSMQNLRGLGNNPYAQRLLQGLMMQSADRDYASGLAETQRGYKDAEYKRGRTDKDTDYNRKRKDDLADRIAEEKNKIAVKKAGLGVGPFQGTSMEAQDSNMLINGDPSSAEYRSSYARMAQPKTRIDPNTGDRININPDMSPYRIPTGSSANNAPQSQTQGQTPGQPNISVTEGKRTKPYPEFQSKSAGFYNRMMDANKEIDNLFAGGDGVQGTRDDLKNEDVYNWHEYARDNVPFIGNALTSENFKRAQQAQRNWVSANLRLESGAAIPPEEMEMEFKKYFPTYGDGDAVIQQKARARKKVEQNMRTQSQGAYESMYGVGKKDPTSGAPPPPSGFEVVN